ncbi:hypothetical protein [Paraburkholderia sp. BCC1885]|uniref:hypothetical protein n=1 Tax=Paraburkholderia sp. BCC1885 TaxID=2562669 RepID=UPI0021B1C826|nr:hypothetical protein [Paraburkholderia sp. BCC1885]
MQDPSKKPLEDPKKQMARSRPGMMLRGMLKVALIAIVASQIMTTAFTLLAQQIDAGLSPQIISVFGFVTCGLISMWLQADARRAFGLAKEKGFVAAARDGQSEPRIAADCPRRWLVVLHCELNPAAMPG